MYYASKDTRDGFLQRYNFDVLVLHWPCVSLVTSTFNAFCTLENSWMPIGIWNYMADCCCIKDEMPFFLSWSHADLISHWRWTTTWIRIYEEDLNEDAVHGYNINVSYHEISFQNIILHSLKLKNFVDSLNKWFAS